MPMVSYRCSICKDRHHFYKDEEIKNNGCKSEKNNTHSWQVVPTVINTVIATNAFMLDDPQLDSIRTIHDLDRILNIEARDAKETEILQDILKNL
jgi:hypothetical protein